MSGSIGKMAESILAEVKAGKLTKLAEHLILDDAEKHGTPQTELGKSALKLAAELRRSSGSGVTLEDLKQFVSRIR